MGSYFTIDRSKTLTPTSILGKDGDFSGRRFFPVQDHFTKDDLASLARELFPGGLTEHGKRYLLDEPLVIQTPTGPASAVPNVPAVELVFELVRRLEFPNLPSRFECLFGWDDLESANQFKAEYGASGANIVEVECEHAIRLDMSLLYLGGSAIGALMFAQRYWSGESGPNPNWETLLIPPVRVIRICHE